MNPCTLQFKSETRGTSSVRMFSLQGKEMYRGQYNTSAGTELLEIDCSFIKEQQVVFLEVENGSRKGRIKLLFTHQEHSNPSPTGFEF